MYDPDDFISKLKMGLEKKYLSRPCDIIQLESPDTFTLVCKDKRADYQYFQMSIVFTENGILIDGENIEKTSEAVSMALDGAVSAEERYFKMLKNRPDPTTGRPAKFQSERPDKFGFWDD